MARITVVNDNAEFLELIGEILSDERHTTTLIDGDRDDALQRIKDSRPELLMIDLRMGRHELHGWEIAQDVRRDPELSGLPVLVCSADVRALQEIATDLETSRFVRALQKPFSIDELSQLIDELLAAESAS